MNSYEVDMSYHKDPFVRNYQDRGMVKWAGFYLSEHTSSMEKEQTKRRNPEVLKQEMSEDEIENVLSFALLKNQFVSIQLLEIEQGVFKGKTITGKIVGYDNGLIQIVTQYGKEVGIDFEEIYHGEPVERS